ncbi:uncharacterized protein K441DRAFT_570879, partial [Cenococcum geophilum 1.58]|uniref:uncharacterized protein n=1 Tax=Cenococcum geophilum 1.58 TaxID=794803 RepID=UPI00358F0CCF
LKNTLKYFSNIFRPHFSKGQDLRVNSPKEILILDDDINALEIICNILYLRNNIIPNALNLIKVLGIAVTTNKFNYIVAVKYTSTL